MASYPWEQNVGASQSGEVNASGGGGGGPLDAGAMEPAAEPARPMNAALAEERGPMVARPEDFRDYGAGGPGLEE